MLIHRKRVSATEIGLYTVVLSFFAKRKPLYHFFISARYSSYDLPIFSACARRCSSDAR